MTGLACWAGWVMTGLACWGDDGLGILGGVDGGVLGD